MFFKKMVTCTFSSRTPCLHVHAIRARTIVCNRYSLVQYVTHGNGHGCDKGPDCYGYRAMVNLVAKTFESDVGNGVKSKCCCSELYRLVGSVEACILTLGFHIAFLLLLNKFIIANAVHS